MVVGSNPVAFFCSAFFSFVFFYNFSSITNRTSEIFAIFIIRESTKKGGKERGHSRKEKISRLIVVSLIKTHFVKSVQIPENTDEKKLRIWTFLPQKLYIETMYIFTGEEHKQVSSPHTK